jgi:hypothetical protein
MAKGRRRHRTAVLVVAFVLGCAMTDNAIRIAPAPTADSLVLLLTRLADTGQPATSAYGLSVLRCNSEESLWTVAADGSRRMPMSVVYGRPIAGFPARTGPFPLTPGCYEAVLSGAAPQRFEVQADRTITTPKS